MAMLRGARAGQRERALEKLAEHGHAFDADTRPSVT